MMKEQNQKIDTDALIAALKRRDQSLAGLAKELKVSPSNLHRWVTVDKTLPRTLVFDIGSRLDLEREEMDMLLMAPRYHTFFRRQFLGDVPEETKKNAIELAKTYLNLSTLHSAAKFCPTDLSHEDNPERVAEHIRRYFQLPTPLSFKLMITKLRESGVEVGFVRFDRICTDASTSNEMKEDAFTVTDQNRFVIFCKTERTTVGKLPFVIAHELCHTFRDQAKQGKQEEYFCNDVATEIVYPKIYFLENRDKILAVLEGDSRDAHMEMVDQIVDDLGGEFLGVALRLDKLGFLKPRHKFLIGIGKRRSLASQTVEDFYFQKLRAENLKALEEFWSDSQLSSHPIYHYYTVIKRGLQTERMTTRAFSKLFNLNSAISEHLVRGWRAQVQRELAQENG